MFFQLKTEKEPISRGKHTYTLCVCVCVYENTSFIIRTCSLCVAMPSGA